MATQRRPGSNPSPLVHDRNLRKKESDGQYNREYLAEIRTKYNEWNVANIGLVGPSTDISNEQADKETIAKRVALLEEYKTFIDQQHYAEHFDSRSNLHSTVLEEFLYYLFADLVRDFGANALIGKSHAFKDIFFVPPRYSEMVKMPYGRIEKKDHDFVIGTTVEATFTSSVPLAQDDNPGGEVSIIAEEPVDYDVPTVRDNVETHVFDIPAIAIECKTYLDKTMLEGSSRAAEEIKARNPNGLYIVVMEWIKLTDAVNLRKYKVDQIYVLRKQKNTDRKDRYRESYIKNPIDPDVVWHLFKTVRDHLTRDWEAGVDTGLQRGWLIG